MAVKARRNQSFCRSEEDIEQLLPGIPDEITLDKITSRLPWTAFHILSAVSRSWQGAIRSRKVYNARVHAQLTETLVVHCHYHRDIQAIALYSPREDCCYKLPALRHLAKGVLRTSECISLDGKIYVMGGLKDPSYEEISSAEVYVFDVAGQRLWEQCASIQEPREQFGCGVLLGKIYVLGGAVDLEPVCRSEVYDPKRNTWSPIKPLTIWRTNHHVSAFGEELYVYGGEVYGSDRMEDNRFADSYEVYDPAKNEWRLVELPWEQQMFMGNGKFYTVTDLGIYVFDVDKKSWTHRHTNGYAASPMDDFDNVSPVAALAIKDELFACADWEEYLDSEREGDGMYLIRSKGFNDENERLVWQKTNCYSRSLDLQDKFRPFLCLTQL